MRRSKLEENENWEQRYNEDIEDIHRLVLNESDSKQVIEKCLQALCQARLALGRNDLVDVELYITIAKGVLSASKKSKECEAQYGKRIILYEILWLSILLILIPVIIWRTGEEGSFLLAWVPIQYYLWGGVGGVTAALLGFVRHSAERDLDIQFIHWYYIKPIFGLVIGPIIYLILACGILAVGVSISQINQQLFLLIAWLAGFSERFSLGMLDTVMSTLLNLPGKKKPQSLHATQYQIMGKE